MCDENSDIRTQIKHFVTERGFTFKQETTRTFSNETLYSVYDENGRRIITSPLKLLFEDMLNGHLGKVLSDG